MGRRRRSLLDPRGVGSTGSTPPGDESSSEVDWHSREAGEFGRSSRSQDDFDDEPSQPYDSRSSVPGTELPKGPVRFSSTTGPTLVNETPDSGADPMSTPLDGLPRRINMPLPGGQMRPSGGQMPPPAGYQRPETTPRTSDRSAPGQRLEAAVDAPVAQDLFGEGGYDDFESANPPTDEFPAQVMEDVGQPYTTPFSVPDAPPIPGILDRFTPPPAHRTEIGSRRKKSEFLTETPQAKDRYQPTPSPVRRKSLPRSASTTTDPPDRDEEPTAVSPLSLWIGIGGVLFFLVGVVSLVVTLILVVMSNRGDDALSGEREPVSGGVEIRDNMTRPAPVPGDPGTGAVPGATGDPVAPVTPTPEPPVPAPDPKAKVAPVAPVAPPPAPVPAGVAGHQSLLKIRSNRRVLTYVDNRAIGYTPQDVPVEVGKHRVTAKLPGQPNSEQGRDAVMTDKKQDILVEFSF